MLFSETVLTFYIISFLLIVAGGLLENDPYGLVKGESLMPGRLGELVAAEALQAEEAGGIAFVNGYFQVSGGVKQGEFLAFGDVGVGF